MARARQYDRAAPVDCNARGTNDNLALPDLMLNVLEVVPTVAPRTDQSLTKESLLV